MAGRLMMLAPLLLAAQPALAESKAGTKSASASVNIVVVIPKVCWDTPEGRKCNYKEEPPPAPPPPTKQQEQIKKEEEQTP